MDAGSLALLHRLVSMGARSLLQYVCQASTWSADNSHAALDRVRASAAEERDATARLTRHLQKKHLRLAPIESYPSHFTTLNFVTLDYVLPLLIAEHEKEIAEIEGRLHEAKDEEIRVLAEAYLERKRRDLATLKEIAADRPLAA
jgi:hypothetical protein